MDRDYYYFREVFLGLREEYLKNRLELEKLKKYVNCNDDRINDFYFWLFRRDDGFTQVWLYYDEKRKSILNTLKQLIGIYYTKTDRCLVKRDRKNGEISLINSQYNVEIDDDFMEILSYKIEEILQSDFVNNMCGKYVDNITNKNWGLTLSKMVFKVDGYYFDYFSIGDEFFSITNSIESRTITTNQILNLLDEKIPKSSFSEYHQRVIENNLNLKEFEFIDNNFKGGYAEMVLEEDKGRILCKKRDKRTSV